MSNAATSPELPRLVYLGDVPIEASYHGSALLYRLLQTYPADRLVVIEAGIEASKPERRLTRVRYYAQPLLLSRLQNTRFAPWYTTTCLHTAALRAGRFERLTRSCQPDAILTATHGYSWITAAEIARRLDVPLQLICHDEWARAGAMQDWKDRIFGKYYRAAASRLCVSPFMAREYAQRYGVDGLVLYPARSADAVRYVEPPERLGTNAGSFTCAFAGTINSGGVVSALQRLAHSLGTLGGRLVIYGPLTREIARASGLAAANIELGGLLSSGRLMDVLRERAHALFVPMSFDAADRNFMQIGFPSKLTDYSAVGLPLLIYGPPYCSAVQWATENVGVAEVVTEETEGAVSAALSRLAHDPLHRITLAQKALAVGETYFSHRAASEVFYREVAKARPAAGNARSGNSAPKLG